MSIERVNSSPAIVLPPPMHVAGHPEVGKLPQATAHQTHQSLMIGEALRAALLATAKPLRERELSFTRQAGTRSQGIQHSLHAAAPHAGLQLDMLRQQLRQLKPLKDMIKSLGGDPSRAHLLLGQVAHESRQQGNDQQHARARAYLEELQAEHGAELASSRKSEPLLGQNIAEPQLRFGLSQAFYQHLFKNPSLPNLLEAILQLCGEKHCLRGVRALQQVLANDIAQSSRLAQQGKQRALMQSLGRVRQLNALLQGCSELIARTAVRNPALNASDVFLLQQLLSWTRHATSYDDAQTLCQHIGGPNAAVQRTFLNGLRQLLIQWPHVLWNDDKSRQDCLTNVNLVLRMLSGTLPRNRSGLAS